eukprot:Protomagalhaensia_sp_Gyna_25__1159@NODE_156_length_4776_cov_112_214482_g121_i0_p2_GENE_NODE_156_length_4776_cov_112_214482_g121_i0NODE_156_length_4776_cov_112_214482_g121_i0_p2_ORF_typecomplete_len358_score78_89AspBHydro_N/PF05279_11/2_1e02AspBHydro_N/PF05279_11/0_092eIF3c_N/PF05470_12/5_2RTC/PF01137_21/6_4TFIIF_alpha/PF05793_12/1TFIIF_alpha/PF05793_12/1_3e02_NODE_156_length_4776_cov_112_214482_g121_i036764749
MAEDTKQDEESTAQAPESPAAPSTPHVQEKKEPVDSKSSPASTAVPSPKAKKGSFRPKGDDITWVPKVADIVWTRFDKSRTQALAIIIRCPKSEQGHKYDTNTPSVYCESDADDRYLVAFINSDAHVYPPRHYLVKFDFDTAMDIKCMKSKVSKLTPWDKLKRKAVRDALEFVRGEHKFENSHNFRLCCTCCAEGADEFWKKMGFERGTIHIEMQPQLERQKEKARKAQERKEREAKRKAEEKEQRLRRQAEEQAHQSDEEEEEEDEEPDASGEEESSSSSSEGGEESEVESDFSSSEEESKEEESFSEEDVRRKRKKRRGGCSTKDQIKKRRRVIKKAEPEEDEDEEAEEGNDSGK